MRDKWRCYLICGTLFRTTSTNLVWHISFVFVPLRLFSKEAHWSLVAATALFFSSDSVLRAASSVNDDHPTCSTGRRIQYHIVRLLLSYLVHIPPASIHDLPIRLISSFRDFRDSAWPLNLNVLNLAKVDGTARSSVYNTTQHTYCCLEEEFFQSKRYTNRYKI